MSPAARPAVRGRWRGMLHEGRVGPATGAAGDAMWPPIGLTVADHLGAPVTLWHAPGVPTRLGAVMAQPGVLDAEPLWVAPHRVLPACLPALRHAPAAPHLPRPLAIHTHPPQRGQNWDRHCCRNVRVLTASVAAIAAVMPRQNSPLRGHGHGHPIHTQYKGKVTSGDVPALPCLQPSASKPPARWRLPPRSGTAS